MNTVDWQAVAKAELHELRIAILELAAIKEEVGPKEVADLLDEPLGNVSYHFRQLVDVGLLEETRTEPRRGAVAHFYRLAPSCMAITVDAVLDEELVAA